jgi:hypothetical protein
MKGYFSFDCNDILLQLRKKQFGVDLQSNVDLISKALVIW